MYITKATIINDLINDRMPQPSECGSCPMCWGDCRTRIESSMQRSVLFVQLKTEYEKIEYYKSLHISSQLTLAASDEIKEQLVKGFEIALKTINEGSNNNG